MSTNRVYLRSDSNTPSTASSKRPRANEDRDTSSPRVKVKRTDSCGLQVSNIVPSNASAEPAVTQVTTNAQVPANADFLTPGAHTESNDRNNAAVRSVPQNSNPSTPGSSTRPFSDDRLALRSITAGDNSDAGRPLSLNRDPSTPGPYVTSYDKPAIARADQPTTSAAQTMSQDFKSMSHQTTTHEDDGSAARNVQKWNEGRGPNTTRNVYGEPSESSLALESDRDSQPSVATPLANSTSAALSNDLSRWMPTPFKLVELGHTNQRCPRVEVSPESELSKFLDVGLHPVASAIAGIHIYGHENPVPQEATQVLRMFYDIYRSGCNSPHVTFLDPLLYRSGSYPQAQLETFRKKEWAWLVHVGRLISFPGILCESWELVTIRPDYQQLEIALVLSNDNRLMTYLPDRTDPPPGLDTMEVSHRLHICSEVQS